MALPADFNLYRLDHPQLLFRDLRRVTLHITYYRRDFPNLLQEISFPITDIAPSFPMVRNLLANWERKMECRLNTVRWGVSKNIVPRGYNHAVMERKLN